jgi:brefeldin A-resistance guanine nucleotide exchange factor 1
LLSKLFLRYLPALMAVRHKFHLTLLNTLTSFERYVHLGRGTQLAESVRECVKNMLLVMSSSGVFDAEKYETGKELWELSWAVVDQFYPELRAEMCP